MAKYYPSPAKAELEIVTTKFFESDTTDGSNNRSIVAISNLPDGEVELISARRQSLHNLARSVDGGETWTKISFGNPEIEGTPYDAAYYIKTSNPDVDRSLLMVNSNAVFIHKNINTTGGTGFDVVLDNTNRPNSTFARTFGFSAYRNIILLAEYGTKNAEDPPRFVYISYDYGETFDVLYEKQIGDMVQPNNYHIHDVAYDPYANRIWIAEGDGVNANIVYTDNLGLTFISLPAQELGSAPRYIRQPTSITPLPDKVVFGSDFQPTGFCVYDRDTRHLTFPFSEDDLKYNLINYTSQNMLLGYASKAITTGTNIEEHVKQYPYNVLFGFVESTEGLNSSTPGRIFATPNGEQFFEIMRPDILEGLRYNRPSRIVGAVSNDPNKYVYFDIGRGSTTYAARFKMPTWVEMK